MSRHYLNLTNGLLAIKDYGLTDYRFLRIQSTACEQKRWDFIIQDLDTSFLMDLAMGRVCYVYDYGAKKDVPRALWQGLEWVRYVLHRRWMNEKITPRCRGNDCSKYFDACYQTLESRTLKKLDYFQRYLSPNPIQIMPRSHRTEHDGDYVRFRKIACGGD